MRNWLAYFNYFFLPFFDFIYYFPRFVLEIEEIIYKDEDIVWIRYPQLHGGYTSTDLSIIILIGGGLLIPPEKEIELVIIIKITFFLLWKIKYILS